MLRVISRLMVLALALCLGALVPAARAAGEEIHWLKSDLPPQHFIGGPYAGQGYGDVAFRVFQDQVPEFRHLETMVPVKRSWRLIETRDNYCRGSIKTPARTKIAHFTKPVIYLPTPRVIMSKDALARLPEGLTALEPHHLGGLRLGYVKGRHFTPAIDAFLYDSAPRDDYTPPHSNDVFKALARGTIDAAFGYPFESWHAYVILGLAVNFEARIFGGDAPFNPGYIACSKSAQGLTVVNRINSYLDSIDTPPEYYDRLEAWIDPATGRALRAFVRNDQARRVSAVP